MTSPGTNPPSPRWLGPWRASLLGAGCLVGAFPPLGIWPLAFAGPALLAHAALGCDRAAAAWRCTSVAGLVFFLFGIGWLAVTSPVNLVIVSVAEAPLIGLFGWAAFRLLRQGALFPWLPMLWTAHEMIRFSWPMNGFTWLGLGHAAAASPLLVQVADLGGVFLVTFVVASGSSAVLARLTGRAGARPAAAVVALALLYGFIRPGTLDEGVPGPVLATIQPGFPQRLKDDPGAAGDRWATCLAQVRAIADGQHPSPDLLVFPETMWPWIVRLDGRGEQPDAQVPSPADEARLVELLARDARHHAEARQQVRAAFPGRPPALLLGAAGVLHSNLDERDAGFVNTALYHGPDDAFLGRYDKSMLVPGGEFLPLIGWMPESWQRVYEDTVRSFAGFVPAVVPGAGPATFDLLGESFSVTICYENVYGDYTRRMVGLGARFLVNISNEGWFGESAEFDHMELQSILRAVETRRAIFRSTNTGVSCLVRPDGRPPRGADRLAPGGKDRGVAGVFVARVPLHDGLTPYVRLGDWPGFLCLAGSVLLLLARRPRRVP